MNRQRGFTLVEAAIATGVVAILAGTIIPLASKSIKDAKVARAKNDIQVIAGAIADQFKDMGCRPRAAGGPGGASGAGFVTWKSQGRIPDTVFGPGFAGPIGPNPLAAAAANSFENLFLAPNNVTGTSRAQGARLFEMPFHNLIDYEFGYKGPYLVDQNLPKTDPWGRAYMILGYNQACEDTDGPVWVVSAGPSKQILHTNAVPAANGHYRSTWDYQGVSAGNIAVRVH